MSHQQLSRPSFQSGNNPQRKQSFTQVAPKEISQAVNAIEAFKIDAEIAKNKALQNGHNYAAKELRDLVELVDLQKKLIVRRSWYAPMMGQCIQEGIQRGLEVLQQSSIPEVQRLVQDSQQLVGMIHQASSQEGEYYVGPWPPTPRFKGPEVESKMQTDDGWPPPPPVTSQHPASQGIHSRERRQRR